MSPKIGFFSSPINLDLSLRHNCPPVPKLEAQDFEIFDDDAIITNEFRAYMRVVEGRFLDFEHLDRLTGEVLELTIPAANSSRYTRAGRNKIRRKLMKRLGKGQVQSVLLTLTVDPKRYSKAEAWKLLWSCFAAFRRDLWKYLERHGWKHNPYYIAVIEQHKSGFPHLHICYPGLRYLAPKEIINKCWRMGTTHETVKSFV